MALPTEAPVLIISTRVVHHVYETSRWSTLCGIKVEIMAQDHMRNKDLVPNCLTCISRKMV